MQSPKTLSPSFSFPGSHLHTPDLYLIGTRTISSPKTATNHNQRCPYLSLFLPSVFLSVTHNNPDSVNTDHDLWSCGCQEAEVNICDKPSSCQSHTQGRVESFKQLTDFLDPVIVLGKMPFTLVSSFCYCYLKHSVGFTLAKLAFHFCNEKMHGQKRSDGDFHGVSNRSKHLSASSGCITACRSVNES